MHPSLILLLLRQNDKKKTSIWRKEFNLSNLFDIYILYIFIIILPWNIQIDLRVGDVDDDDERETDQLLRDPDDQSFFNEHVSFSSSSSFFLGWGEENGSLSSPLISPIPCDNNIPLYIWFIHSAAPSSLSLFSCPEDYEEKSLGSSFVFVFYSFIRNRFAPRPMIHYDVKEHVNFSSDSFMEPNVLSNLFFFFSSLLPFFIIWF